ncbi:thioesterase domain-containing protein [Paenibacillus sp. FSL R7-0048]|uniref:thioesterase II family protein n=1 Tax=Paenibacillus TaxID=44249 RepID=UPI00096D3EC8|nr:thioesterase domain-containing protein [Paenibacillus odorifer]OMD67412.1 hypothetical protein BSK48_20145 [Paenibacillus odorifer]OMD78616.1 hypothetical protein BSK53_23365 [Paenibacillus odorifer]
MTVRLICLPYAGGSASVFLPWKKRLPSFIELCPIEYGGRGKKSWRAPYVSIEEATEDIWLDLHPLISEGWPYAFYGHSMGVLIVFELVNRIYGTSLLKPEHLFLTGRNPPHLPEQYLIHQLTDREFAEALYRLGGTPEPVLFNLKFQKLFFPIIRSDLQAVQCYEAPQEHSVWDSPLTIVNGSQDEVVDHDRLREWSDYTRGAFHCYTFSGDHFFINEKSDELIKLMASELSG